MTRLLLPVVLVAALAGAGCVDLLLADEGDPQESEGAPNETNETDGTPPPATTTPLPPTTTTPTPPAATTPPVTTSPPPPTTTTPPPPPVSTTPPTPPTPPTPTTPEPTTWPREGSYVTYRTHSYQSFSGSDQGWTTDGNVTWTYRDGDWTGECVLHVHDDADGDGVVVEREERTRITADEPPHWPLFNTRDPPEVGEDMTLWYMRGCAIDNDDYAYVGTGSGAFTVNGQSRVVAYHEARAGEEDIPYAYSTRWSQATGLVLEWDLSRYMTQAPYGTSGTLVATDATL